MAAEPGLSRPRFALAARTQPFSQASPAIPPATASHTDPETGVPRRDGWRTGVQSLMPKRMLIDSTHAEETRVVVLDGNRLEDFDIETSTKRQLKGNIYLAKVVRVEPSLQAAFVEYGGNRHGFLAFSEIHPDYYQIPVADRQRLLALQAEEARLEEEEEDLELALNQAAAVAPSPARPSEPAVRTPPAPAAATSTAAGSSFGSSPGSGAESWALAALPALIAPVADASPAIVDASPDSTAGFWAVPAPIAPERVTAQYSTENDQGNGFAADHASDEDNARRRTHASAQEMDQDQPDSDPDSDPGSDSGDELDMFGSIPEEAPPETVGGDSDNDDASERPERRFPPRFLRNYQIQEVIHRRQILLIQVVKEERGTKGAALTTYLSLAGRFSVLMPNSPRGGGISRKITSAADRRRLKEIMAELDVPKGMGLIVRTAGAQRPKPEIKRDCEYLLRLWDDIRDHTLKSIAPAMIYEEASLIKRAIRDVYSRDIDDITVDGEAGWRAAHEFMRMLMPSHARKVIHWPDQGQSLFARFQVEAQLDAMMQPTVQLRSGGYLVIDQAEALVAIDVNSGRSTRERNVEETAVRTNLEAADEVARQLRLRDLAGLIVIDFIDMESKRHNAMVERRLKEALKDDRARIQVGHISHFGLLEMSRQRLRPSLEETTLIICQHCNGTGHVRGTESAALHVLRGVEEEAGKRRAAEVIVHIATPIALYILNHKRERLNEIERRYGMRAIIAADDSMIAPRFRIERLRAIVPGEEPRFVTPDAPRAPLLAPPETIEAEEDDIVETDEAEDAVHAAEDAAAGDAAVPGESREDAERRRRRRRRRRGGRDDKPRSGETAEDEPARDAAPAQTAPQSVPQAVPGLPSAEPVAPEAVTAEDEAASRRRSRRGGSGRRSRRRDEDGDLSPLGVPGAEQPDLIPAYASPTPADPYGSGHVFDIFDVMEQAELNAAQPRRAPAGRRNGQNGRSRWQPAAWAVASHPPMLAAEPAASDRPERDPQPESWALPSRPFMLRRDRHTPRWAQQRGIPVPPAPAAAVPETREAPRVINAETRTAEAGTAEIWAAAGEPRLLAAESPPARTSRPSRAVTAPSIPAMEAPDTPAPVVAPPSPVTRAPRQPKAVPIEAGPPPAVEPVAPPTVMEPLAPPSVAEPAALPAAMPPVSAIPVEAAAPEVQAAPPAEPSAEAPRARPDPLWALPAQPPLVTNGAAVETVDAAPEPLPVPANDVVSGPAIQPILIGSEAAPPATPRRGWWRRG